MRTFTAIYDEKPIKGQINDRLNALIMNGECKIYYNCQANGKVLTDKDNSSLLIPHTELLTEEVMKKLPMEPMVRIIGEQLCPRRALIVCFEDFE